MKVALLLLGLGSLVIWMSIFTAAARRGRVMGPHPVQMTIGWVEHNEHASHFWAYLFVHVLLSAILAGLLLVLWNTPAF